MTKRYKVGDIIRYFDTEVIITEVDDWGYHGINASIPFVAEKYCTLIKAGINMPNEKCKDCYYYQDAFQFCNYPFNNIESIRWGIDIGTHYCTAYGNKYFKNKKLEE